MGNSATKEERPRPSYLRLSGSRQSSSINTSGPNSPQSRSATERSVHPLDSSRNGRGSRSDLSNILGLGNGVERDATGLESRRETKQEREARKIEKERIMRERERERSMREESVDGGFLVTQGVYTGIEDYNKSIVRQLMIERRIAPFWRGLNDHSDSWTENQLVAVANGRPVPAPDEIPTDDPTGSFAKKDLQTHLPDQNVDNLTIPITSRSQSYNSESSINLSLSSPALSLTSPNLSMTTSQPGSALFKGRAKTLASLTTSSRSPQGELKPREMSLPQDSFISGQPIEAYLYKDAAECPICFLYYPPYLNKTRCCDQAICSECFVQIKRPDPHPPEHVDPSAPPPPPAVPADPEEYDGDSILVSEPAACPFCVQPEFGVTFEPAPFRRGLTYVNQTPGHPIANASSAMSSASSLESALSGGGPFPSTTGSRRRTTSISATSSTVITTDRVRPDWHQKLAGARAHAARRSAAATALHTAAYLMGNRNQESDGRSFAGFGRRGILRRGSGADVTSGGNSASQLNMLALMSERIAASANARAELGSFGEGGPGTLAQPLRGNARRTRVDDLEEMMMMEAIRLSLASEEDRRKREEKDAKKEAKRKEKENKKAEKIARKTGAYSNSVNQSTTSLEHTQSEAALPTAAKGKGVHRTPTEQSSDDTAPSAATSILSTPVARMTTNTDAVAEGPQGHLERARAWLQPQDPTTMANSPYKPSHLRTLSNASSSASSMDDSASGSLRNERRGLNSSSEASPNASGTNISRGTQDAFISGTPPGGGAGIEPMFNFRSLAAMVGEDEKVENPHHFESAEDVTGGGQHHRRGESSGNVGGDPDQEGSVFTSTAISASNNVESTLQEPLEYDESGITGTRLENRAPTSVAISPEKRLEDGNPGNQIRLYESKALS